MYRIDADKFVFYLSKSKAKLSGLFKHSKDVNLLLLEKFVFLL